MTYANDLEIRIADDAEDRETPSKEKCYFLEILMPMPK
jgi:hypothetical protein